MRKSPLPRSSLNQLGSSVWAMPRTLGVTHPYLDTSCAPSDGCENPQDGGQGHRAASHRRPALATKHAVRREVHPTPLSPEGEVQRRTFRALPTQQERG